jgi:hypothetical protein
MDDDLAPMIGFRLPWPDVARLDKLATRHKLSRSEMIRSLVRTALEGGSLKPATTPANAKCDDCSL